MKRQARVSTCKVCGDEFTPPGPGNYRFCEPCRKEKAEEAAKQPRTSSRIAPQTGAVRTETIEDGTVTDVKMMTPAGAIRESSRYDEAKGKYRAHLQAGEPPSNVFEGELAADYGLNRTQVLRIRDELLNERKGVVSVACANCHEPFDRPKSEKRDGNNDHRFCPDCRPIVGRQARFDSMVATPA